MPSYAAFLGHQPHVSLAELSATIPGFHCEHLRDDRIALFTCPDTIDAATFHLLGGTVVLAEALDPQPPSLKEIPQALWTIASSTRGKITFGLRTAGLPPTQVRTLYRACKEVFRGLGRPCRYIGNDHAPAPTALLRDAGILDGKHGCELVILADDDAPWIGKTLYTHDIDAYTMRDVGKPARDARTGLLPPKLAQVMLNLGWWLYCDTNKLSEGVGLVGMRKGGLMGGKPGVSLLCTVLDPFCGSGVIPMECLLRGWPALASDSAQRAVDACKRNIDWLRRKWEIPAAKVPSGVWKHNALQPFDFTTLRDERLRGGPNLIVTETTLGPALRSRPTKQQAQKLRTANEKLQRAFLENVAATLPTVPVVCMWPVWYLRTGPLFLEKILHIIEKIGLEATLPPGISTGPHHRPTLLYRRPDQFVGREIVLLKKRK